MGLVCAALNVSDTEAALAAMRRAKLAGADLAELRLDLMEEFNLERLLDYRPLPVVVTYRRKDQGGGREYGEAERLTLLSRALELGADYVDVELGSHAALRRSGRGRVIVSHHDFAGVPADLPARIRELVAAGADIVKLAVTPAHPLDCLPLYELPASCSRPVIAVPMGEFGAAGRVLALRFGGFLSFAALAPEQGTAPGQMTVEEMARLYRAGELGDSTRLFGVIGDPIGHSLSPAVHNAAYRRMGLDAVYVPFRVPDRPAEFMRRFAELGFEGFSVTIPHKEAALAAADDVDDVARQIGAANTIVVIREASTGARRPAASASGGGLGGWEPVIGGARRPAAPSASETASAEPGPGGPEPGTRNPEPAFRLRAHNTDADAAVAQLTAAFGGEDRLRGRTVLLLGAGGAARAAGWGLTRAGVRLVVVNRTEERGRQLAAELDAEFRAPGDLEGLEYDAAVNATPLGMSPNIAGTPLAAELIRPGAVIFDTVYNPLRTRLLREAKDRGARPVDGMGMFVEQAVQQIRIWTGQRAWPRLMREAALERLGEK